MQLILPDPMIPFLPPKYWVAQLRRSNLWGRTMAGWHSGGLPKVRRNEPRLQHESLSDSEGFILNLPGKWKTSYPSIVPHNSQVICTNGKIYEICEKCKHYKNKTKFHNELNLKQRHQRKRITQNKTQNMRSEYP